MAPSWPAQEHHPVELTSSEVHLWLLSVTDAAPSEERLFRCLSDDERVRAERFRFDRDRATYVAARGGLRELLSQYLSDTSPEDIRFECGRNGKPHLLEQLNSLKFNLSHSGDFVLYAIAKDRDIGVDIERMSPLKDFREIAARVFLAPEIARVNETTGDEQVKEFYRFWVRGEALLKCSGVGLVEPAVRACLTRQFDGRIDDLPSPAGYAAAIAVTGGDYQLRSARWNGLTRVVC